MTTGVRLPRNLASSNHTSGPLNGTAATYRARAPTGRITSGNSVIRPQLVEDSNWRLQAPTTGLSVWQSDCGEGLPITVCQWRPHTHRNLASIFLAGAKSFRIHWRATPNGARGNRATRDCHNHDISPDRTSGGPQFLLAGLDSIVQVDLESAEAWRRDLRTESRPVPVHGSSGSEPGKSRPLSSVETTT